MGKKSFVKKKQFQQFCKTQAVSGKINNAAGVFISKSQAASDSMKDNYHPQAGKNS